MKTIFLAEGKKHVRVALRLMLEDQPNFSMLGEAGTPESTLAQVCIQPPDVILLDWSLPGLHPQRLLDAMLFFTMAWLGCIPPFSAFELVIFLTIALVNLVR